MSFRSLSACEIYSQAAPSLNDKCGSACCPSSQGFSKFSFFNYSKQTQVNRLKLRFLQFFRLLLFYCLQAGILLALPLSTTHQYPWFSPPNGLPTFSTCSRLPRSS